MKSLSSFEDLFGFTGHFDPMNSSHLEFGDGLQRLGFKAVAEYSIYNEKEIISEKYMDNLYRVWLTDQEPRRYWDDQYWYGKLGTVSGDQIEPNLYALLIMGYGLRVRWIFQQLKSRYFFAWNYKKIGQQDERKKIPDFTLLRFASAFSRAYNLYLLTWVLDLFLIPKSIFRCIISYFDHDECSDDLNFMAQLECFRQVKPTLFSFLARDIYLYFRASCGDPGSHFRREPIGPISAVQYYFSREVDPPLDVLWTKLIYRNWMSNG